MKLTTYVEKKARHCKVGFVSALKNARRGDADCKYIWFSPNWLPYLLATKERIYNQYPFEMVTSDATYEAKCKGFSFIYPQHQMREEGQGAWGGDYSMTDRQYHKADIRHRLRKILFDFGIFPLTWRNKNLPWQQVNEKK